MQSPKIKNIIPMTLAILSISTAANAGLGNGYGINIDVNEHSQSETWSIHDPGIGLWIENGAWQYSDKLPACLLVLKENLDDSKFNQFLEELDATTVGHRKLPLESFRGTWSFVDRDPQNSSFVETDYYVKTKNNMTFGQLLQYVGGTQDSRVVIFFDEGCTELNPRAFLPTNPKNIEFKSAIGLNAAIRSVR